MAEQFDQYTKLHLSPLIISLTTKGEKALESSNKYEVSPNGQLLIRWFEASMHCLLAADFFLTYLQPIQTLPTDTFALIHLSPLEVCKEGCWLWRIHLHCHRPQRADCQWNCEAGHKGDYNDADYDRPSVSWGCVKSMMGWGYCIASVCLVKKFPY